jgi:hypothetical protein
VSAPFVCQSCGDSWEKDPQLAIPCPICGANAGAKCLRPSEHRASIPHKARRTQAFELAPCSCLRIWEEGQRQKGLPI